MMVMNRFRIKWPGLNRRSLIGLMVLVLFSSPSWAKSVFSVADGKLVSALGEVREGTDHFMILWSRGKKIDGVKISRRKLKKTLETTLGSLGATIGTIKEKGKFGLTIAYKNGQRDALLQKLIAIDATAFLKKSAGPQKVVIAATSLVASSGVRASKTDKPLNPSEFRGRVISAKEQSVVVEVISASTKGTLALNKFGYKMKAGKAIEVAVNPSQIKEILEKVIVVTVVNYDKKTQIWTINNLRVEN